MNSGHLRYFQALKTLAWAFVLHACSFNSAIDQNDVTPPQVNRPGNLNHIAQVAANAGVNDCLGRLNQISSFLIKGNPDNSVAFFMSEQEHNNRMLSTSFEMQTPQALTYATAYFAPRGAAKCDGAYEAVAYWPDNCGIIAKKNFVKLKRLGAIHKNIVALEGGAQLRVFLMPAGNGCVSIKKELVY